MYVIQYTVIATICRHPLMKKLLQLRLKDEHLAKLLALQLFDNSLIAAGVLDDPKQIVSQLNELLTQLAKAM